MDREKVPGGKSPFYARVIKTKNNGKGYWDYLTVGVFQRRDTLLCTGRLRDKLVGQYNRNYHSLMKTFYPFERNGKWYALYSKDYTATRVMSLPDCKDIGGEKPESNGFCPAEIYVPKIQRLIPMGEDKDGHTKYSKKLETAYVPFGLIAGCVWGDDSSWKVMCVDLRQIENGILKPDDRFGYVALPRDLSLEKAVRVFDCDEDVVGDSDKPRDEHTYQMNLAVDITYRMFPDGKMTVYHKDMIADSTAKDEF